MEVLFDKLILKFSTLSGQLQNYLIEDNYVKQQNQVVHKKNLNW